MISITKAVKTRWDDLSLSNTITGGVHHSEAPDRTSMPYAIYSEIDNEIANRTYILEMGKLLIQWDVYTDDGDPETCADLMDTIDSSFYFSMRSKTNT